MGSGGGRSHLQVRVLPTKGRYISAHYLIGSEGRRDMNCLELVSSDLSVYSPVSVLKYGID